MKKIFISLTILLLLVLGMSCSSSKSGAYPKRLQRPVKCSACASIPLKAKDTKVVCAAYNRISLPSVQ